MVNNTAIDFIYNNLPLQRDVYMWSTFIMPDGRFINIFDIDSEDSDIGEHHMLYHYLQDNGYKVNDMNAVDFGLIKLNSTYPYIAISKTVRPTSQQYRALENWIDNLDSDFYILDYPPEIFNNKVKSISKHAIMVDIGNAANIYDLDIYGGRDIVDIIKHFYVSGVLED